jgi:hypothetical protein
VALEGTDTKQISTAAGAKKGHLRICEAVSIQSKREDCGSYASCEGEMSLQQFVHVIGKWIVLGNHKVIYRLILLVHSTRVSHLSGSEDEIGS